MDNNQEEMISSESEKDEKKSVKMIKNEDLTIIMITIEVNINTI